MEEFIDMPTKVYIKVNLNNEIIEVDSSAFIEDITGWIEIDSGKGDKYRLAQHNYFDKPIMNEDLSYNYVDGIIKNNKEVLFRYNPRTKEISELTIDKDLAQQIVENSEKQFKFLKKVTRAWQNRQNSIL